MGHPKFEAYDPMADLEGEVWRPVLGWEECYLVSNFGRVRSLPRMIKWQTCAKCGHHKSRLVQDILLRSHVNQRGYPTVRLSRLGRTTTPRPVHQLVCEAFYGPRPSFDHEVLHGNGEKTDNRSENLRWGTKSENAQDRFRHGTAIFGRNVNTNKLSDSQVRDIRSRGSYNWPLAKLLAVEFDVTPENIKRIMTRLTWKHL